jgi:hypothetical protein
MRRPSLTAGIILMASAIISIGLSAQAREVLAHWQQRPQKTIRAVTAAIEQILIETESYIKANKLSGQSAKVRSGTLRQDLTHELTDAFGGHVGTTARTAAYARTILGPDAVTIKPVNAKHLWVPSATNLQHKPSSLTPREAMELTTPSGKRRLRFFTSKKGNLVAFLPDVNDAGKTSRHKRKTKGGRKKGDVKGKLLFTLKDEVTVQGTDALAGGAQEMQPRMTVIFNQHLEAVGP